MKLRGELFKVPARSIQPPSRAVHAEYCWAKEMQRAESWSHVPGGQDQHEWRRWQLGEYLCVRSRCRELLALMPRKFDMGA